MKRSKREYQFKKDCGSAVRSFLALELLFQAALMMLGSQFEEWNVPVSYQMGMQVVLILVFLLFEVVAPVFKSYRMLVNTALELVVLAVFGLYAFLWRAQLQSGYQAIYNDFVGYWNKYNGSNYGTYDCDGSGKELALCFTILMIVIFSLTIRSVTGIRLLLLLPGFLTLSLGLLVNTLPNWGGLAFFFLGVVVLYSGSWENSKVTFQARQGKKHQKQAVIAAQMSSLFCVAVIGIVITSLTPLVFGEAAGIIPKNAKSFMKFQQSLEEKAKNLGNVTFGSDKVFVDNQTPEYTDREILTIRASQIPSSNLYLKDFSSGTYVRGEWKKENDFSREAKKAGYDPVHLMTLLNQCYYEQQQTLPEDEYWNYQSLQYTISYQGKLTNDAFVPYFSDLSENGDIAWYDENGIAKKKRNQDSLSFQGLEVNAVNDINMFDSFGVEENEAFDWYNQYVLDHYRTGSEDVPIVKEYAQKIAEQVRRTYGIEEQKMEEGTKAIDYLVDAQIAVWREDSFYGYDSWSESEKKREYSQVVNNFRLALAGSVNKELRNIAEYNLYLNQIPDGTDTIQYFLETGQEGYCMHFASAGVLLLQELGVPARYASGYVVRDSAFYPNGEEYQADVIDRNGHAWVEIYLEDYGWVPYEMTPQYRNTDGNLPTDEKYEQLWQKKHEEKVKKEQESQATESSENIQTESESESGETEIQTESQDSESSQGKNNAETGETGGSSLQTGAAGTKKSIRLIGIILLIFFVLTLVLWQAVRASRRYKGILIAELHARQNRRAVRRMNRRIYQRLWNHAPEVFHMPKKKRGSSKVQFSYLTDEEYLQKLIRTYPAVYSEDWKQYMKIVQKAVFSQEEITQEEVKFCYGVYRHYRDRSH